MQRRRILFYSHTRQVSGAERVLLTMLGSLAGSGFARLVACPVEGAGDLDERVRATGTPVLATPAVVARFTSNPVKLVRYLASFARAMLALRAVIAKAHPELVHANSIRAGVAATLATSFTRQRVLWHVQDDLPDHPISTAIRLLARLSRRTGFVAVSAGTAQAFAGSFNMNGRLHVLHNAVDLERFPRKTAADRQSGFRASLGIAPGDLLLVAMGMINPRKGLLELVEAFALALPRLPAGTHLALVGAAIFNRDDLYLSRLRTRIAALGLTPWIHLAGASNDAAGVLRSADLLILNARVEPFGLVLIEAAASGTPVLATEVAGPLDILREGERRYGFLTPPPNRSTPAELAACLVEIGNDAGGRRAMADTAYEMVRLRFTLDRFKDRLQTLYH